MGTFFHNLRVLSILGVVILLLMLTGVSCSGGTDGTAVVSKAASTTYTVSGYLRCDHDDSGTWMDDSDHTQSGYTIWYQIEGGSTSSTTTDGSGYYFIDRGDNVYVDVWLVPQSMFPHWRSYYVDLGGYANWADPSPVVRVPANQDRALDFIGSDHT